MRLGVLILPELRWAEAGARWRRAEELGLDHAWTYDHIAWRTLRDGPWFGAVPTLTAAALATTRLRLGTLVATPNFRHPVPFARDLLALEDVSGGRFTLGVGAGGSGWDAAVLGQDPWSARERADRFAEFVELTDLLLREPVTTYRGRYYVADAAPMAPGCLQRPRLPFAVAAAGRRGMRLAAMYGQAWVTTGPRRVGEPLLDAEAGAAAVRAEVERLDEACAAVGRLPATLDRIVLAGPQLEPGVSSPEAFRDTLGRYAEVGATDLVLHWPRPSGPYAGDEAAFERAVAR